jgi:SRSO17 transposase
LGRQTLVDVNHGFALTDTFNLPAKVWKTVTWREGTRHPLRSRFAAVRVRPAHRDHKLQQPREQEWLLIEWPRGETEPRKYWLSNLAGNIRLRDLVALAKQRWTTKN